VFFFFWPRCFSFTDLVPVPFVPMVTNKGTSLFFKFTEICEVDGRNELFVILGNIANVGSTGKFA
jgi:hypothetical protein